MIGPYDEFADLEITDRFVLSKTQAAMVPKQSALDELAHAALKRHRLELQPTPLWGQHLVMLEGGPDGGRWRLLLERSRIYSCAEFDEVKESIEAHIAAIAEAHGPGRVWFLLTPVHYICDDDRIAGAFVRDYPSPLLVMRTFYAHEKQARLEPFTPARSDERVNDHTGFATPRG